MNPSWHSLPIEEAARTLGVDLAHGLSAEQVSRAPAATRIHDAPAWKMALDLFVGQWKGSVIIILTVSAAAFWYLGHRNDSIGIFVSVVFAVALGFITDFKSQRSLAALRSLAAPTASVLRGGHVLELPTSQVVRGDVVILHPGNSVPADGRLFEAQSLTIEEAALTGESAPRAKRADRAAEGAPLAERTNMAYAGTSVLSGSGTMLVTEVGLDTELGRIGKLVHDSNKEDTPLETQVEELGRRLALLVIGLSVVVTGVGLLLGQAFTEMLETGFLLAIAAIPEGLPAVYTVALASGVRRMVRAHTLVRRIASVEVLGSVDVVCTDKTGTLTENAMRAATVVLPGRRIEVTGSGYAPEGAFSVGKDAISAKEDANLQKLLWIGAACNNAVLESHSGWHIHGTPTEGALLTLAMQGGVDLAQLKNDFDRLSETPFTSDRKLMSVVVKDKEGRRWSLVKGAVGAVLPLCAAEKNNEASLRTQADELGGRGLRVLAFASRELSAEEDARHAEQDLLWAGMAGLLDPPRRGAAEAVAALSRAGVRTIMVTGDQQATAVAIAERVGLLGGAKDLGDILKRKAYAEIDGASVFARVTPEEKLRLVEALKSLGHVVAMTGDGINDAPALKASDIGIAMGAASSDVAKEAADLVVTDAEYATLVSAVDEGRTIYSNLRRSVRFLLLCSLANIGLMLGSVLFRTPLTLTALQLLWLNLVVHIFPGMALAVAPSSRRFMEEAPRKRDEAIMSWRDIGSVAPSSLAVCAAAYAVFAHLYASDLALARTSAMTALALGLLFQIFPSVAEGRPVWEAASRAGAAVWLALLAGASVLGVMLYWPPLNALLLTVPLSPAQWLLPLLAASASFLALLAAHSVRLYRLAQIGKR
jgi:Ca2+-transporting ATPase